MPHNIFSSVCFCEPHIASAVCFYFMIYSHPQLNSKTILNTLENTLKWAFPLFFGMCFEIQNACHRLFAASLSIDNSRQQWMDV